MKKYFCAEIGYDVYLVSEVDEAMDEQNMEISELRLIHNQHEEQIAALKENELHLRAMIEEVAVWGKCREEYVSEIAALTTENKRLRDRLKSHGDIETDKEEIAQAALGKEENDAEIYDTYTR